MRDVVPLTVAAFYRFAPLPGVVALCVPLESLCAGLGLVGTVLLAPEGINGTLAGPPPAIDALIGALRDGPLFAGRLAALDVKYSTAAAMPFGRLKVRVKREIVTFGDPTADPTVRTGIAVDAADWNAVVDDPGVTLLDTRNHFEVAMGTFGGATDPNLRRFSDFRAYAETLDPARHTRVAMFCTGGIRCEKASAYLLGRGFETVYQLQGGILRYLETVPAEASRWTGACFVFDERIALGHGLRTLTPTVGAPRG